MLNHREGLTCGVFHKMTMPGATLGRCAEIAMNRLEVNHRPRRGLATTDVLKEPRLDLSVSELLGLLCERQ